MAKGRLYGVGVGPGDPQLMTLKAAECVRQCDVLALPDSGSGDCVALHIAQGAVPEAAQKPQLHLSMPMVRNRAQLEQSHQVAAQTIIGQLEQGRNVALLTLGDPAIYSTCMYVYRRVREMGYEGELIPGVPSFCAAAAGLEMSLGEGSQPIHIIPGSYPDAEQELKRGGNKVIMKSGRSLGKVQQLLQQQGQDVAARVAINCGMEGERYCSLEEVQDAGYFSIVLVPEGGR